MAKVILPRTVMLDAMLSVAGTASTPGVRKLTAARCYPELDEVDMFLVVDVPDGATDPDRKLCFDAFRVATDHPKIQDAMRTWQGLKPTSHPRGNPLGIRGFIQQQLRADGLDDLIKVGAVKADFEDFYCFLIDENGRPVRVCYHEFDLCDSSGKRIEKAVPTLGTAELRIVLRYLIPGI